MIDPVILRTEPDLLRESQRRRGESVELVDELVAADEAKRSAQTAFDGLFIVHRPQADDAAIVAAAI